MHNYYAHDGLPSAQINQLALLGDTLYAATAKGLAVLNIGTLPKQSPAPRIHLTNISLNWRDTALQARYELPHNINDVGFEFRGLSYQSGENVRYRYQLTNADRHPRTGYEPEVR